MSAMLQLLMLMLRLKYYDAVLQTKTASTYGLTPLSTQQLVGSHPTESLAKAGS
jgi:hypothetical protein